MTDKYIRKELPDKWKSLITGSEYDYHNYHNIEEIKGGKLPLPRNEYPYTITYYNNQEK